MLRDQDPEQLAAVGQGGAGAERGEDARELDALRQRELAERKSRALQRPTRHSRFGGSYVIQGLKAIGDRDVVFHKGLHNPLPPAAPGPGVPPSLSPAPAGAGGSGQVHPGQVLRAGGHQQEGLRGAALLEEPGSGARDDRGLRLAARG
uniref:Timeless circadian regulator n=1 Tax=Nothoprocta perdicaria TaxID=30464 RepID=A0A8C6YLH6_NOTPE